MNEQTALVAVVAAAVLALAALAFVLVSRKRSERLRKRFGPEYELEVERAGDARKAEARLEQLEKRVEKLHIRPVPPELADRFTRSWKNVQARFVDEPPAAVREAHALVKKVMETRGYPMGSFEERAADISVDHPGVVSHYRAAHAAAARQDAGEASTEDLRQAFVHYRALFDELLEVQVPELAEVNRG